MNQKLIVSIVNSLYIIQEGTNAGVIKITVDSEPLGVYLRYIYHMKCS